MKRGELYRVRHPPGGDPKRSRVFCVVSRQALIDSMFVTLVCAPVFTAFDELETQVPLGTEDGMKQECSIHCDNLMSLRKEALTDFVATLSPAKMTVLDRALAAALELTLPINRL